MKFWNIHLVWTIALGTTLVACGDNPPKSPDVTDSIRQALNNAGLKDISVSQDRDKGVVTLGGHVTDEAGKTQAESLAKSLAAGEVVANQITVTPVGAERDAKAIDADLDKAIEKNLDAALLSNRLNKPVKFKVKGGVVTLTGDVASEATRTQVADIAGGVPNVSQVVNELQVKNQKATSTN